MNRLIWMRQCRKTIEEIELKNNFNPTKTQAEEILQRYSRIRHIMQQAVSEPDPLQKSLFTEKLDNLLLHRVWGYVILLGVLFLLFQSVFWLAQFPMDWIELGFAKLSQWLSISLPDNRWTDLLINGVIAGHWRHLDFCAADNDIVWVDNIIGRYRLYGPYQFFI